MVNTNVSKVWKYTMSNERECYIMRKTVIIPGVHPSFLPFWSEVLVRLDIAFWNQRFSDLLHNLAPIDSTFPKGSINKTDNSVRILLKTRNERVKKIDNQSNGSSSSLPTKVPFSRKERQNVTMFEQIWLEERKNSRWSLVRLSLFERRTSRTVIICERSYNCYKLHLLYV